MDKKVSIIIPVYNCKKYVGKSIQSALNQTYKNGEIIVVDDGSTDGSGEICEEYAKKAANIRVIHQENKGLGETRNVGISCATGDYLTYLDSDDYIALDCIERVVEAAEKYKVDMVEFGKVFMLASKNIFVNCNKKIEVFNSKEEIEKNKKKMKSCAWGRLYTRELVSKVAFPKIRLYEDVVYANEVFKYCNRMMMYNYCLYAYRAYQDSLTRKKCSRKEIRKEYIGYKQKIEFMSKEEKQKYSVEYIISSKKKIEEIAYRNEEIISQAQIKEFNGIIQELKQQEYLNLCAELDEFEKTVECALVKSKASVLKKICKHFRHIVNRVMCFIKIKINYEYRF